MAETMLERGAGILMPVSSLPSPYGIGSFGKAAYEFIDTLVRAKQKYWQVLPMGPTGYGDSPYAPYSAFAGNPYFIDLDVLKEEKLLEQREIDQYSWGERADRVDYGCLYNGRFALLQLAFSRSQYREFPEYGEFAAKNVYWLDDYAMYMALKKSHQESGWMDWEEDIRRREPQALARVREELAEEIDYWKFIQFKFWQQWKKVRDYANERRISIIGDIPLYVAFDSADVWSRQEQFQLNRKTQFPAEVAGVPPDAFSETGQLWGNPLYNWTEMVKDGFVWWTERMKCNAALYDVIRIDHFIGITQYFAIPYGEQTAVNGHWRKGPGKKLTDAIDEAIKDYGAKIIAEDLGVFVPAVQKLLEQTGYPGMKVIEFAFSGDRKNPHLPHCYVPNSVVYGGTHDNETLAGYFRQDCRQWWELQYICDYLGVSHIAEVPDRVFRAAYGSVASAAIFQMQDVIGLDNSARMNTPGSFGGNWCWRMLPGQFREDRVEYLAKLTDIFGRI